MNDARVLGFAPVDPAQVLRGLLELGRSCFEDRQGIVRMQASADARGGVHLVATARDIGPEPLAWRLRTAPHRHPGGGPLAGVKLSGQPIVALVRRWLRDIGDAEEALLYDADGRLVEGSRSTPILEL